MASVAALAGTAIPTNNTATIMPTPRASRLETLTLLLCGGVDVRSGRTCSDAISAAISVFQKLGEATRDAPHAMVMAMSGPTVRRDRASNRSRSRRVDKRTEPFRQNYTRDQKHSNGATRANTAAFAFDATVEGVRATIRLETPVASRHTAHFNFNSEISLTIWSARGGCCGRGEMLLIQNKRVN